MADSLIDCDKTREDRCQMGCHPVCTCNVLSKPSVDKNLRSELCFAQLGQRTITQMPGFDGYAATIHGKRPVKTELIHIRRKPLIQRSEITAGFIFPGLQLQFTARR